LITTPDCPMYLSAADGVVNVELVRPRQQQNPLDGLLQMFGFGRSAGKELEGIPFDRPALKERGITMREAAAAKKYVMHLQGHLGAENLWDTAIAKGGEAGTRALIHEVAEMRDLKAKGIDILKHSPRKAADILAQNKDAHAKGLKAEYDYWRQKHGDGQIEEFMKNLQPDDKDLFLTTG
jgi:hypothetical protein